MLYVYTINDCVHFKKEISSEYKLKRNRENNSLGTIYMNVVVFVVVFSVMQ